MVNQNNIATSYTRLERRGEYILPSANKIFFLHSYLSLALNIL